MPRPNYPTTGGPHLPSWNMREARQRHRPHSVAPPAAKENATVQTHPPAVPSIAPLSVVPASPSSARNSGVPAAMLYVTAFLSLAALLFTVLVFLHRG